MQVILYQLTFPGVHISIEGARNAEFAYFTYYILERGEQSVQ